MTEFRTWRDIRDWADRGGYKRMVKRMDINNACWNSSGEFGRSQVAICDAMRFTKSEEERIAVAEKIEASLEGDYVVDNGEDEDGK